MKGVAASVLVAIVIVHFMMIPGHAIDCGQVDGSLANCIPFLTGVDAAPSSSCCAGVKSLKTMAPTTPDRRAACDCIKAAAARYPNLKDAAAASLPKQCGVEFNIPISKTTNCQAIN